MKLINYLLALILTAGLACAQVPTPPPSGATTLTINSTGNTINGLTISTGLSLSGGVLTATSGGGNVTAVSSPSVGQTAQWASGTTIMGVANTGSGNYVLAGSPTISTPTFTGSIVFPSNTKQTFMPGSTVVGFNAGSVASNPSTLANGDLWYNTTSNVLDAYINGAVVNLGSGGGFSNPMTTTGDLIYASSGATPGRLGIGSTGNVLTVSGGIPAWVAPTGGGNVSNSGTPTSGQIAVWTGSTNIQGVTNLSVPGTLSTSSTLTIGTTGASTQLLFSGTSTSLPNASIEANATNGLDLIGTNLASTYDLSLCNSAGAVALGITHGTTSLVATGALTVTGTSTLTGAVLVGTTSYTTALSVGNNSTSTGTTTPASINLGYSYGTNAAGNAGNLKVILYPGNGIGIDSSSTIEYQSGVGIQQAFYTNGGTLALTLDTSQNATFKGKIVSAVSGPASVVTSTGGGTGGSATASGTDTGGLLTLVTGTTPSASALILTFTYGVAFPSGSQITSVSLQPANALTAALSGTSMFYVTTNHATFTMTSGTVPLAGSSTYAWYYQVQD